MILRLRAGVHFLTFAAKCKV